MGQDPRLPCSMRLVSIGHGGLRSFVASLYRPPLPLTHGGWESVPNLDSLRFVHWRRTAGSIGAAIEITRTERTAEALRWFAAQSNNGPQIGRLLALAPILEGQPRLCVRAL